MTVFSLGRLSRPHRASAGFVACAPLMLALAVSGWSQGPQGSLGYDAEELDRARNEQGFQSLQNRPMLPTSPAGSGRTDLSSVSSDLQALAADAPIDENQYIVGPGDLFQIFVESEGLEKRVNAEGNIVLNRIGVVRLEGLTLKEAKKLVLDRLQSAYKRSNCFVGLSQTKMVRVPVTGAVLYPGIYDLPGNFRVTDAIRMAGGYSGQAQKGVVEFLTAKGAVTVNTKDFLLKGDIAANPYVCQSCVLKVPYVDFTKPWTIVRRDSVSLFVPLEAGETVHDVIMKAYAYRVPVVFSSISVKEKNGDTVSLSPAQIGAYHPKAEAVVEVAIERHEVFVGGAVQSPGFQKYRPGRKVAEYVSNAGLLPSSRVSRKIPVIRKDGSRATLPLQSADVKPGDVLLVNQNIEQKFLIYTPIFLSMVSLALVYVQISSQ